MIMREELLCDEIYKTWLSIVLFQQFTSEEYIAFLCTTSTNNNIFVDYNLNFININNIKGKRKGTPLWGTHRLEVLKHYRLLL